MKKLNLYSYMVTIGILLFVIHNPYQPLKQYLFLPWIGMALLTFGAVAIAFIPEKPLSFLKDKISLCVLVISSCIAMSGVMAWFEHRRTMDDMIADVCLAVALTLVYLSGKIVGKDLFKSKIIIPAVVIESLSIPIWGAFHNFVPNGGLVSPTNYDIATGFIVFGILISPKRHWLWLSTLGGVCLLFSGSGEAIFVGFVAFLVACFAKVERNKLMIPAIAVCITTLLMVFTGIFPKAQAPNFARLEVLMNKPVIGSQWVEKDASKLDIVTGYRISNAHITLPIKPFGYGINLTNFYWGIPHNIVLIIIEQAGILALLAWLSVAYFLIKQKSSRYIWIVFVSMGFLDHFLFTQALPWWFALSGVLSYVGVSDGKIA